MSERQRLVSLADVLMILVTAAVVVRTLCIRRLHPRVSIPNEGHSG